MAITIIILCNLKPIPDTIYGIKIPGVPWILLQLLPQAADQTVGTAVHFFPYIHFSIDHATDLSIGIHTSRMPGHGCEIFDLNGLRFRVVNLIGRCTLQWNAENPFTLADQLLKQGTADFTLVDFHAEATSEKLALGYYLDGRVSALWGTHTHVPTADERVYPKGTGYITDLGMTGPIESVLGVESAQSVESFLGGLPGRYRSPDGPCKLQGAIFTLDSATGLCTAVERVDIR